MFSNQKNAINLFILSMHLFASCIVHLTFCYTCSPNSNIWNRLVYLNQLCPIPFKIA